MSEIEHGVSAPPTISVIVPVYNTEQYLRRCIDSVLAQTYQDFELLLIDDGSKDSSGAICDEYAAQDARVRVFHKENGGVSSARNMGLDNAQGEWITFVDADDYIEENFLKSFEGNLDADLVVGNSFVLNEHSNERKELNRILSGKNENIKDFLNTNLQELICRTPWGKLYRANIIADLRFNENMRLGEDTLFNLCYFRRITNISVQCNVLRSSYVYIELENCCKKYQMSVQESVCYMTQILIAYDSLKIRCKEFEDFIICFFHECCVIDIPVHGAIWYRNKVIRKYCLRRSARMGVFAWIKALLLFHGLYRLKIMWLNRHSR